MGKEKEMSRKGYFNDASESWDEKFYTPELLGFLKTLVPMFGLKPGHKVLDLGTGTGVLIPFLFDAVGPTGMITAVDYAEHMIRICESKYAHLQNVTFELQDVEELGFPSGFFHAVTCFGLFPHLEDRGKALSQMNRVLKPGGRLIIAHALSSSEIKAHHREASSAVSHDMLPEEHEMRHLLKHAGFVGIRIKDESGCYLCISSKP